MGNHVKAWRVLDFKNITGTDRFNPALLPLAAPVLVLKKIPCFSILLSVLPYLRCEVMA
jgi:hypothetical protein